MSKVQIATSKKLLISLILTGIIVLSAVVSIILVFATTTQDIELYMNFSYTVDGVGAKISMTSALVSQTETVEKEQIQDEDGNNYIEFIADDQEFVGTESKTFCINSVEMSSKTPKVVYEIKIENTAESMFVVDLNRFDINQTNTKVRYKSSIRELLPNEYRKEFGNSTFYAQPILDTQNSDRIVYLYISIEAQDKGIDASYSADLNIHISKVDKDTETETVRLVNGDGVGANSLRIMKQVQGKSYAMPMLYQIPEIEGNDSLAFEGYYTERAFENKYIDCDGSADRVCDITHANTLYAKYDSKYITKNGTVLTGLTSAGQQCETLVISDSIEEIKADALKNSPLLKSVTLPETLTVINERAFMGCSGLESVNLESCEAIKTNAFKGCESLTEINVSDHLKTIGEGSFAGCTSLENIIIPGSVETIGSKAFAGCTSLNKVYICSGVDQIIANSQTTSPFYQCSPNLKIMAEAETVPATWANEWDYVNSNQQCKAYLNCEMVDEENFVVIRHEVCENSNLISTCDAVDDEPINFKIYGNSQNNSLPAEYQEVEYIQSSGTQYIQLPYGFESTDKVVLISQILATANDKFLVSPSTWNNNNNRFAMGGIFNNLLTVGFGNVTTSTTRYNPTITISHDVIYTETYKEGVFTCNTNSYDTTSVTFGGITTALRLFYGYNACTTGKIYYFSQTKLSGEKIILIPCYRKSDNVAGLYDLVSKTFFTNNGTGTFVVGSDIDSVDSVVRTPTPSDPLEINSVGTKTKNILDNRLISQIKNGITYSVNCDKTVSVSGTSVGVGASTYSYVTLFDFIGDGKIYTLSGCPVHTLDSNYTLTIHKGTSDNVAGANEVIRQFNKVGETFTTEIGTHYWVHIYVWGNITVNALFKPQLEEGSMATEYEPYNGNYKIPISILNLPDEYQEVEYIQSSGNQYINTHITDYNNLKYETEISIDNSSGYRYIEGDYSGGTYFLYYYVSTRVQFAFGSNLLTPNYSLDANKHKYTFNNNGTYASLSIDDVSLGSVASQSGNDILICGGTETSYATSKHYSKKFWRNNVLIHNFIPCYRKADNVIGMYDTVTNTFFTNDGTGTFIKGPDVVDNTTNIYLDEPLRKVGDVADYIDLKSGKIVRNVGHIVLTGNEDWYYYASRKTFYLSSSTISGYYQGYNKISSHFIVKNMWGLPDSDVTNFGIHYNTDELWIRYPECDNVTDFKAWLAEQYANGTPVEIDYVLKTPYAEEIELPTINLGGNYLKLNLNVASSKIEIDYYID